MAVDKPERDTTLDDLMRELRQIRMLLEKQAESSHVMTPLPEIHIHGAANTDVMLADILRRATQQDSMRRPR